MSAVISLRYGEHPRNLLCFLRECTIGANPAGIRASCTAFRFSLISSIPAKWASSPKTRQCGFYFTFVNQERYGMVGLRGKNQNQLFVGHDVPACWQGA